MTPPNIEQVSSGPTLALVVQDRRAVARDLRVNAWRAVRLLPLLTGYCLVSALVTTAFETDRACGHCFKGTFSERFGDAIYFTWINITTVGFGDFSPQSIVGKVVAAVNALFGLLLIGWIVAILAASLSPSATADPDPDDAGARQGRGGPLRWLSRWIRGVGRWIMGRPGAASRPVSGTVFDVTVRDAEVARLGDQLTAANVEAAHLKEALARERGIVDDLVLGRADREFRPVGDRPLKDLNFLIRELMILIKVRQNEMGHWPAFQEEVRCLPDQNAIIVVLRPTAPQDRAT
ncbi:potassium channel family protein [Luteibacter sp. UNCMF366Tsu5.1]|uniref:potassium channel family protein n=1 Tax=Luteibacter sp. UNCMF366Tsu5.1 TaxID=1502758 RepID=UPI000908522E|nr:potassium channel family protein [Luteibacter sp. UNCMF366Tsu5.1]SFW74588.1 Ion channel [Luteibacter sp. UNCMF366Tsu5.1]